MPWCSHLREEMRFRAEIHGCPNCLFQGKLWMSTNMLKYVNSRRNCGCPYFFGLGIELRNVFFVPVCVGATTAPVDYYIKHVKTAVLLRCDRALQCIA